MAKGSKKGKTQIPEQNTQGMKKFFSKLVTQQVDKTMSEELEKALYANPSLRQELDDIISSYESAEVAFVISQEESEKAKKEYELKQESLIRDKEDLAESYRLLEQQNSEIEEKKKSLDRLKTAYEEDLKNFLVDKEALENLQRQAELGFVSAREKAFFEQKELLEQEQSRFIDNLTKQRNNLLEKERDLNEREATLRAEEDNAKLGFKELREKELKAINESKQTTARELDEKEQELSRRCNEQLIREKEFEIRMRHFDDQKMVVEEFMRKKYLAEITELKVKNEKLNELHHEACDRIGMLSEQLLKFADFERQLEGLGIDSIQDEISRLKEKNRELKEELQEYKDDDHIAENDRLEISLAKAEDELYELREENQNKTAELYRLRMSSAEKQQLLKEKRVLESHNSLLDRSIEQLKTQIDDLTEQQQGHKPFKLLSDMDSLYRSPARGLQDVPALDQFVLSMQSNIAKQNLFYSLKDIRLFVAGLAMSKLHLLQGISGTGKTSLARAFAKAINNVKIPEQEKNYCEIVRVQAGWRDREDLLGHFNAFEKRFYTKEALQALYRAQQPQFENTVQIILLDEMNLSQPEQYFADFLSLMETPDRAEISLLDSSNENSPNLFIDKRSIKIPENIWFIGTANHDETTKEFADKTYDRAHVMEVKRSNEVISIDHAVTEQYSYQSLKASFVKAKQQYENKIKQIFDQLKNSGLDEALLEIGISWGNRLERQAEDFMSVYIALGGTASEALDHLLATKVFRRGKVVGRYDTREDHLELLLEELESIWKILDFKEKPQESLNLLNKDLERLRGGM